jgi:pyruvate-ferredoxin/flavodoxin oxidoreductase
MMVLKGDSLPVSAMPADGTFPSGTTKYEKRNIAIDIPLWDPSACIQCGKCSSACPHASIRAKVYPSELLKNAPETFKSADAMWKKFEGQKFTIQIAPEDCTGCGACVHACPGRAKDGSNKKPLSMVTQMTVREQERKNWDFFLSLPDKDRAELDFKSAKDIQLLQPLFEFSGACAGCGETPYLKLLSSLFGDRAMIANATGCSSIYGGNLPTTPWATNSQAAVRPGAILCLKTQPSSGLVSDLL